MIKAKEKEKKIVTNIHRVISGLGRQLSWGTDEEEGC
jgi:hypothetical protein